MVFLITLLLALILQLFLPWWTIAIAASLPSLMIPQSGWKSFQNGFLAIFILWLVWSGAIYYMGGDVLAQRLAMLLTLPSPLLTVFVTGIIGGLTAGFWAWTANRFRAWFRPFN